jgi:hypothetical protein
LTALATVTIRPADRDEIPAVLELWRGETVASATDSEKALRQLCALQPAACSSRSRTGRSLAR